MRCMRRYAEPCEPKSRLRCVKISVMVVAVKSGGQQCAFHGGGSAAAALITPARPSSPHAQPNASASTAEDLLCDRKRRHWPYHRPVHLDTSSGTVGSPQRAFPFASQTSPRSIQQQQIRLAECIPEIIQIRGRQREHHRHKVISSCTKR